MLTLEEVKSKIYELGNIIGMTQDSALYPMFATTKNVSWDGAYICVEDSIYYYIEMDRGRVVRSFESRKLEDILFYLFYDITFDLAIEYEIKQRKQGEDFRRILFAKQLELLLKINKVYYTKGKQKIDDILKTAPFRD